MVSKSFKVLGNFVSNVPISIGIWQTAPASAYWPPTGSSLIAIYGAIGETNLSSHGKRSNSAGLGGKPHPFKIDNLGMRPE